MLEAAANHDDPFVRLKELVEESGSMFEPEYEGMIEDVNDIMTDYFKRDWGKDSLTFIRRSGKSAEHEFEIDLVKGIVLEGKLDAMAKTPDKRTWLVENKTFGRLPTTDHRWRNLQSNVYIRAVEILGLPEIDGLCWNYIHNSPPSVPRILKNGKMSTKRINTIPARLRRFFLDAGLKEKDFPVQMKAAHENLDKYFTRIFSVAKKKTVDLIWRDLVETSKDMVENHGKLKAKTVDRHCDYCDYEAICRAELTGGDVAFVKRKEYYVSDYKR